METHGCQISGKARRCSDVAMWRCGDVATWRTQPPDAESAGQYQLSASVGKQPMDCVQKAGEINRLRLEGITADM